MPVDIVRVWCGLPSLADPPEVLEVVDGGRKGRWILRDGVSGSAWSETSISALPHHI